MRNWSNRTHVIVWLACGAIVLAFFAFGNRQSAGTDDAAPGFVQDDVSEAVPAEPQLTCETLDEGTRQRIDLSMLDSRKVTTEPSASVQDGDFYYAAAAIDPQPTGMSTPLAVVVRGKKFSTQMLAVNGTAKTFTNLTPLGRMPEAASFALGCVTNGSQ